MNKGVLGHTPIAIPTQIGVVMGIALQPYFLNDIIMSYKAVIHKYTHNYKFLEGKGGVRTPRTPTPLDPSLDLKSVCGGGGKSKQISDVCNIMEPGHCCW